MGSELSWSQIKKAYHWGFHFTCKHCDYVTQDPSNVEPHLEDEHPDVIEHLKDQGDITE